MYGLKDLKWDFERWRRIRRDTAFRDRHPYAIEKMVATGMFLAKLGILAAVVYVLYLIATMTG